MKKLSVLLSILFIGSIFAFISCSKTGPAGPTGQTGPAGPSLTGSITGNVIIANQYGDAVTNDYANGYITLKNSTTGATVDSITASSTGQYTISNIPTGTYNMFSVYAGYGTSETLGIVITGGTRPEDIKLAAIPTFTVSTATDSVRHKTNINYLLGTLTADPSGARTILVFVGSTPATSSAPGTYSFIATQTVAADSTTFTISTALNTFYANGFAYGSTAYFAIYGAANNYTYGDYTNYTYGQVVYTAISSAPFITVPSVVLN